MSRTFRLLLSAVFAALLFNGCAPLREALHLPAQTSASPGGVDEVVNGADAEFEPTVESNETEALLTFLAYVQTLSPAKQEQVYQEVKEQYEKGSDQQTRLRLALLRIQPGSPFTDFSEGQKLLQDYGRASVAQGKTGLGALANLLEALARENGRLAGQLADEKGANERLARQLHELKNIENILRSREVESLPGM